MDYREIVERRRQRRNRAWAWVLGGLIALTVTVGWLALHVALPDVFRVRSDYTAGGVFVAAWVWTAAVLRRHVFKDPLSRYERFRL